MPREADYRLPESRPDVSKSVIEEILQQEDAPVSTLKDFLAPFVPKKPIYCKWKKVLAELKDARKCYYIQSDWDLWSRGKSCERMEKLIIVQERSTGKLGKLEYLDGDAYVGQDRLSHTKIQSTLGHPFIYHKKDIDKLLIELEGMDASDPAPRGNTEVKTRSRPSDISAFSKIDERRRTAKQSYDWEAHVAEINRDGTKTPTYRNDWVIYVNDYGRIRLSRLLHTTPPKFIVSIEVAYQKVRVEPAKELPAFIPTIIFKDGRQMNDGRIKDLIGRAHLRTPEDLQLLIEKLESEVIKELEMELLVEHVTGGMSAVTIQK